MKGPEAKQCPGKHRPVQVDPQLGDLLGKGRCERCWQRGSEWLCAWPGVGVCLTVLLLIRGLRMNHM